MFYVQQKEIRMKTSLAFDIEGTYFSNTCLNDLQDITESTGNGHFKDFSITVDFEGTHFSNTNTDVATAPALSK